jgi:hypothetical protein
MRGTGTTRTTATIMTTIMATKRHGLRQKDPAFESVTELRPAIAGRTLPLGSVLRLGTIRFRWF